MHQPVLLHETLDYMLTDIHGTYVDCTLGGGGHLRTLLGKVASDARIIAIDKDEQILRATSCSLQHPGLTFVYDDFKHLSVILERQSVHQVDGIMMDLGVSSFQLDTAERGFSFNEEAWLDMRMDQSQTLQAWNIVNEYDEQYLTNLLFGFGEEKYARLISKGIIKYRQQKSIDTTLQLADIIKAAVPARYRREKHPGRKTFQALRIAVNSELEAIKETLPQAVQALKLGGRLCVITFHSLEDRLVKQFIQDKARNCICPPEMPVCRCDHRAELKMLTRKPVLPTPEECANNRRARSAKLRAAERI